MEIYLDNSATTRCFPEVAQIMTKVMIDDYGNPSSMHQKGIDAENYVKAARETFAKIMKVSENEIFFTSGGTESDNISILGTALANRRRGNHVITSSIEHPAVLESMHFLEENGFEVTYLDVDSDGHVNQNELKASLKDSTLLVSIMYVNNEIGAVEPIAEIGKIIKDFNSDIIFHVDAVQAFGKYKIHPKKEYIDLMSVSSHKIHGPKGVGMLYVKDKTHIRTTVFGGGQQKGFRSGTENVPGITGMAKAAEIVYSNFDNDIDKMYHLKDRFITKVLEIEGTHVNGLYGRDSAPHVISISFDGIAKSEVLLHALEGKGIYVSSGSACASNKPAVSATLKHIGVDKQYLSATLRFSMSIMTTEEEIDKTIDSLKELLPVLRKYRPR